MVKLKKGKNPARYFSFLVDSGSDYTMLWQGEALTLGIKYDEIKKPEIRAEVADFDAIIAKETTIELIIEEMHIKIPVLIAKEKVERLLGRKGFFDHFDILFQESKQQITLTPTS